MSYKVTLSTDYMDYTQPEGSRLTSQPKQISVHATKQDADAMVQHWLTKHSVSYEIRHELMD